ncbi:DUF937 domain-containing protein [Microcella frigidaquae]|uniref:DUF937 domain-containing protein n=1 Tax=Microcella frigidaquae TaxID=424758 RepID=A0A840X3Z0_9MICO|nr:DUF937 domain-containing protein [Microcella frigidaquae]MBB5616971.1 hypothetical protein [Microcella frigidaquae]NHN45446.1 DUF937 domain-containing protein [Microcella frigidaquae]
MTDLSGLIDMIPIGDIAEKLGVDRSVAEAAVEVAVPAIVGGMAANAKDDDGAASLQKALGHHKGKAPKKLADIDESDGEKIVANVFGAKKNDVARAAATKAATKAEGFDIGPIVEQVLPIIAPIVLAWVANQFLGGGAAEPEKTPAKKETSSGNPLGDLLGGLIGSKEGQDLIAGALGGLLGGGRR